MPTDQDSFGPEPLRINLPEGHPVQLVSEDDRGWFEDHPDRLLRLRFGTDGDPGGTDFPVLVFCPQDGLRVRLPHTAPLATTVRLMELDTDAALRPLFLTIVKSTRTQSVQYLDGSVASFLPMTKRLTALFKECLRKGRRLSHEEAAAVK